MSNFVRLQWRGLIFDGQGRPTDSPFFMDQLSGWLGLPGATFETQVNNSGHGDIAVAGAQGARTVQAGGLIFCTPGQQDALVQQLRQAMYPNASSDDSTEPLTVTMAGRTDTAEAQLALFAITTDPGSWGSAGIPWSAQWRCPDPRVFGTTVTASAPLVINTVGMTLPHLLPMSLPAKPIGGTVTVTNAGNDPEGSPVVVTLSGAQSGTVGVTNVTTGRTVTFDLGLAVTDALVIDTERGGAFLNGEYRPASGFSDVVAALRAAPGVNVFRALGSAGAGSPSISVAVRPASW